MKKIKDPGICVMQEDQQGKGSVKGLITIAKGPTFPPPLHTDLWVQLLKHTKHDFLNGLPKTQHDLNSYVIDLCVQKVSTCFLPHIDQESQRWVGGLEGY